MKKTFTGSFFLLIVLCILSTPVLAQWNCVLSTEDDTRNGTSHQTPSVAPINDKAFVALVARPYIWRTTGLYDDVNFLDSTICNYLVGYSNATDTSGRLGTYLYGSAPTVGLYSKWVSGFDEIKLYRAYKIVATPDSLVYVANNDPDHNILVFKLTKDTVASTELRMKTGTVDIWGLGIDDNGYIYVCALKGTAANTAEVKVFKGIKTAGTKWGTTYDDAPVATINLPDGVYRGLAVSGDGKQIFISSQSERKVFRYTGTPAGGYTKDTGFSFAMTAADSIPLSYYDTLSTRKWDLANPLGMAYLNENNLLFISSARLFAFTIKTHNSTNAYTYSKIFIVNPKTGVGIDTLDIANWYYMNSSDDPLARSYTTYIRGTKHVSGYASSYDVAFDSKKNLYTQSFYCWTAERWTYTGTLPTINLNSVNEVSNLVPEKFALEQNYPNPFNPSTTIRFALSTQSRVVLTVSNILGQTVATLVDQDITAGSHEVVFNASALSSGLYFYTINAGSFVVTKRMMLVK